MFYLCRKDCELTEFHNLKPIFLLFCWQERHRIKQLLASQEILHPHLYNSMMSAMKPIMAINKTGVNLQTLFQGMSKGDDEDDVSLP